MKQLKTLMKQKKLTQQNLAETLNLSRASIYKYLEGKAEPNIETLINLADLFGVTVDYLIGHQTKAGLPIELYSQTQQQVIGLVKDLSDEQCFKLLGYIEGMKNQEFNPVTWDDLYAEKKNNDQIL